MDTLEVTEFGIDLFSGAALARVNGCRIGGETVLFGMVVLFGMAVLFGMDVAGILAVFELAVGLSFTGRGLDASASSSSLSTTRFRLVTGPFGGALGIAEAFGVAGRSPFPSLLTGIFFTFMMKLYMCFMVFVFKRMSMKLSRTSALSFSIAEDSCVGDMTVE